MGARYIGGYIGDDESKGDWLKNWTDKWERDIHAIRKTAEKYPQKSYAASARAVQLDWIFLKRVTILQRGQFWTSMSERSGGREPRFLGDCGNRRD